MLQHTYHGAVAALRTPCAHVSRRQTTQESPEDSAYRCIFEAQTKQHGTEETRAEIVQRQVGAEPEQKDLQIVGERWWLSLLGHDPPDTAGFEASQAFDPCATLPQVRYCPTRTVLLVQIW